MSTRQPINTYVLGVGMTEFIKPRRAREYPELGFEAGVKALLDAQINYDDVELGIGCFCFGATCSAQRVFYQFGMTGIPILNTNNVRLQVYCFACGDAYICQRHVPQVRQDFISLETRLEMEVQMSCW
jgi:hypothetical protein